MAGLIKSAILAALCGILVFFGVTSMFLLLSLLITYYNVTMKRLENATCTSGSCYYPPASAIISICLVIAIIVAVSIFVTLRRHQGKEGKGVAHQFMKELRHELEEVKHDAEGRNEKED